MTLLDLDYRDLTGTFDKLVSIEMIEAVDWRDHDRFFETCAGLLGPDGNASLQAIVIAERASSGQAPRRGCGAPTSTSMPGG